MRLWSLSMKYPRMHVYFGRLIKLFASMFIGDCRCLCMNCEAICNNISLHMIIACLNTLNIRTLFWNGVENVFSVNFEQELQTMNTSNFIVTIFGSSCSLTNGDEFMKICAFYWGSHKCLNCMPLY